MSIVIENLLTNAIKYTAENGKIKVGLSKEKSGSYLFSVEDSGYGIPKSQQEKIFTKLFRADNVKVKETDGNGLGLYMVKSILDAAGCEIWFESEENRGTKFFVRIPKSGMTRRIGAKQLSGIQS